MSIMSIWVAYKSCFDVPNWCDSDILTINLLSIWFTLPFVSVDTFSVIMWIFLCEYRGPPHYYTQLPKCNIKLEFRQESKIIHFRGLVHTFQIVSYVCIGYLTNVWNDNTQGLQGLPRVAVSFVCCKSSSLESVLITYVTGSTGPYKVSCGLLQFR